MTEITLEKAAEILQGAARIAIFSHYNPDPDAYAASCGLASALEQAGKSVIVINENGGLARYDFISGVSRVVKTCPEAAVDLVVVCDCGDLKRVGDAFVPFVSQAGCVLNIDHHTSNNRFGHFNYVDEHASSTSEIVFEILERGSFKISAEAASALYAGMCADSGSFRYSSTTEKTFDVAGRLVRLGASPSRIAEDLYSRNSLAVVRLHSEALANLRLHYDGRVCELLVTDEMIKRCGTRPEDTENLVEKGRDIEGVLISFLIRWDRDIWRISLRSRNARHDVSQVARKFEGGGHKAAAAFRWRRSLEELRAELLKELEAVVSV